MADGRCKVLPQSDSALLAGVIASFVNERDVNDRINRKFVGAPLAEAFSKVTGALKPFAAAMAQHKFDVRPLQLRPAATVCAWAGGQSWDSVLEIAEMEEGDLAMLIVRTADNLRHIRGLKDVFPEAAQTASKSIEKIMREPVVNEY